MRMIDVSTTLHIPLDELVDAVGPEIVAMLEAKASKRGRAVRPPVVALHAAAKVVADATTAYEAAQFTAGERSSIDALIAASKGLRTAWRNFKNQI